MRSLRRYYRRHFGRHGRFHLAALLTIVVVTYLLVPWIAGVLDGGRGYGPVHYEPRDSTRPDGVARQALPGAISPPWQIGFNVALVFVVVVVIVWMTVIPRR